MKRAKTAKKLATDSSAFLKSNPKIAQALKVFRLSYDHYKRATTQAHFYTDTSTCQSTKKSK